MAKAIEKKVDKKTPKEVNKKITKPKKNTKKSGTNSTALRAFLFLFSVILIIAVLLFGTYWSAQKMLWKNPHFIVKTVTVTSDSGWWDDRSATICKYLNITLNKSNIFELKLNELRKKLLKQANILDATIIRTLPNRLDITIIERIPRARIKTTENNLVIDDECMVIRKGIVSDETVSGLPRILIPYNLSSKVTSGDLSPEFKYAMKLIMLTKTDYPLYKISDISIIDPSKLTFYCEFNNKRYQIHMPIKNIASNLEALSRQISSLERRGIKFRTIDLTNRDPIVR